MDRKLQKIGMGFNVYKFNVNRHKTLNHHEIELQIYLCNGTVFLSGDFPFQFNVVSIGWFVLKHSGPSQEIKKVPKK